MEWNRTILIVDDEPETLKGYRDFLSPSAEGAAQPRRSSRQGAASSGASPASSASEGYHILEAPSGEAAIELVKKEMAEGRRVAAGFFDVKLEGGIDGLTTIQEIRKLDQDLRCVVVTAYHDRSVDEINTLFGDQFKDHWDYLNKPFTRGEIVQKARQMISAWNRGQELKLLHEQLVKSERLAAIGQVARGVGHEFGNILLRIMGKADLASNESDIAKIKDHLKVILSASERASAIVRNLQSFSKTQPALSHEKINTPIEEALSLVGHEYIKHNVTVVKSLQEVPPARFDKGRIGQVVLNLLINAMHAIESKSGKGQVVVSTQAGDRSGKKGVQFSVKDTGTGIPDEVMPKIFEYAFTTKGDAGSGIGLAVSKEIVEAHGGQIEVKTVLGQGTEFVVWLPIDGGSS